MFAELVLNDLALLYCAVPFLCFGDYLPAGINYTQSVDPIYIVIPQWSSDLLD